MTTDSEILKTAWREFKGEVPNEEAAIRLYRIAEETWCDTAVQYIQKNVIPMKMQTALAWALAEGTPTILWNIAQTEGWVRIDHMNEQIEIAEKEARADERRKCEKEMNAQTAVYRASLQSFQDGMERDAKEIKEAYAKGQADLITKLTSEVFETEIAMEIAFVKYQSDYYESPKAIWINLSNEMREQIRKEAQGVMKQITAAIKSASSISAEIGDKTPKASVSESAGKDGGCIQQPRTRLNPDEKGGTSSPAPEKPKTPKGMFCFETWDGLRVCFKKRKPKSARKVKP